MPQSTKCPLIIGIAGGSGSGKSTLAKAVAEALPEARVRVIGMDTYFRRGEAAPQFFSPSKQRYMADANRPDTADISRLLADVDALCAAGEVDVIVIEGLMTLHDDGVRARLDLKVFVDTDDDVRVVRRIRRTLERNPQSPLDDIANYYFESAKRGFVNWVEPSKRHADVAVPGNGSFEIAAQVLAAFIRVRVGSANENR